MSEARGGRGSVLGEPAGRPAPGWRCASVVVAAVLALGFSLPPPIEGGLAGEFAALKLAGAPKLHWTVQVHGSETGGRVAEVVVTGVGTRLRGQLEWPAAGRGTWKIEEGNVDVAAWQEALTSQLGGWAAGLTIAGHVVVTGRGEIQDGRLTGDVTVALEDGKIAHAVQGWTLERVTLRGEFSVDGATATLRSEKPFELGIGTISTTRFGARNLFVTGSLRDDWTVALTEARVEIAGGRAALDPCIVALAPPALDVNLRIEDVGLQDIAALVPAGLADAHGRIDGAVRMSWSEAQGFQLGSGELTLGRGEPAVVRLAPSPGFLTDRVPRQLDLLPSWLGPVARWFRAENPAYSDMRQIELGQAELRVSDLKVTLTPRGDSAGRSAVITVTARPVQPGGVVEEVTFAINVSGPLSDVLRLGFNQSFSVETR